MKGRNRQVHPEYSTMLEQDQARQRIKGPMEPFMCCEHDTITAISSSKAGRLEEPKKPARL